MDHSFQQKGKPGKEEIFQGPDVNHFDESYFAGKKWHLVQPRTSALFLHHMGAQTITASQAGLENNEKFYKIARRTFENDGRRIIDATVGGKCKVFRKADYQDIMYTKYKPVALLPRPPPPPGAARCVGTTGVGRFKGKPCKEAFDTVAREDGVDRAESWCTQVDGCDVP
jgi:hypothetical protein